jgi:two-component system cell cycle sensor histidine kinase/response regulator CckA
MATILAVDDNPTNRESLVSLLSHLGHRVLEAGDGLQGLEIVHSDRPDLIIADILMPTMNGFELVAKLRQDPSTSLIPVIFYSATFLSDELQDLARACGVSWVLSKPFESEETRHVIRLALTSGNTVAPTAPSDEAQIKVVQILNNKLFDRNALLHELNAQSERRIEERTSELLTMNHRLQEQIVEREKAEKQLFQLQRLDAIGRLAGGVAHDFNNLLGVVLGESEILLDRSRDEAIVHGLELIRDSARRGADLTRQLLAFGRRQVLEPRVLNLNTVVADLEKLLRRLIGEDIEVDFHADPHLRNVRADLSQIEQVILNLAINARDAMQPGGKLNIVTANVSFDEAYVNRRSVVRPGSYAQLVVSDTGCGMDEQIQSRMFEPFFTTKEQGKGTGLGLAMVYGIIKQSGGYIWVYSEPGHGTAFKIYLPVVEPQVQAQQYVEPTEALPVGSETILLVEDDSSLREVTCKFLQGSGYKVIEAASPHEALCIAEHYQGSIDFLLTDVILPRMNGRELAIQLTAKWPRIAVLYVSGYTDGIVKDGVHGVLEDGLAFLQKPYSRRALIRKVREVLDAVRVEPVVDKQ